MQIDYGDHLGDIEPYNEDKMLNALDGQEIREKM